MIATTFAPLSNQYETIFQVNSTVDSVSAPAASVPTAKQSSTVKVCRTTKVPPSSVFYQCQSPPVVTAWLCARVHSGQHYDEQDRAVAVSSPVCCCCCCRSMKISVIHVCDNSQRKKKKDGRQHDTLLCWQVFFYYPRNCPPWVLNTQPPYAGSRKLEKWNPLITFLLLLFYHSDSLQVKVAKIINLMNAFNVCCKISHHQKQKGHSKCCNLQASWRKCV